MARIDLHAHTTASDGELSPADLVARAARVGVSTLAITDHDTFAGVAAAAEAAADLGVRVITGVELTADVPYGSMHLLAYFPGAAPAVLAGRLAHLTALRTERARTIVERLGVLGVPVRWEDVRARAMGQLGRPHIAAALVDAGHCTTVADAFDRWLADGRPAHVRQRGLDPHEAVRLVRSEGGAPVLAHPASLRLPARHMASFIQGLAARGLCGMEVHRPEHTPEQHDAYRTIARRLRLIPCGGSDFHRPDGPFEIGDTGTPPLPADTLVRLEGAFR